MTPEKRRGRPSKRRDEAGRFKTGFSGNPKGRPRKKPPVPKLLSYQLADVMMAQIRFERPDGKQMMLPTYEVVTQRLAQSLATANQKDLMAALSWMDKLMVFNLICERAAEAAETEVSEEDRQLLRLIKEARAAQASQGAKAADHDMTRPQSKAVHGKKVTTPKAGSRPSSNPRTVGPPLRRPQKKKGPR